MEPNRPQPSPRRRSARLAFAAALALASCAAPETERAAQPVRGAGGDVSLVYVPGVPVSKPPYTTFHASWKTRLDEHYVFLEHEGSYTETGALIPVLLREVEAQGLEAAGPPFALFYDDPATTRIEALRSRACVPITARRSPLTPLGYDTLPPHNVAYAVVADLYSEAPRAYPHLFEYMGRFNWEIAGPIREIYIVPPTADPDPRKLLCEIQIPVATRH